MKKCKQKSREHAFKNFYTFFPSLTDTSPLLFSVKSSMFSYAWIWNHVSVKSWGWPQGWQLPDTRAAQNWRTPHPRTDKAGKCPVVARGGGDGRSWVWLMHYIWRAGSLRRAAVFSHVLTIKYQELEANFKWCKVNPTGYDQLKFANNGWREFRHKSEVKFKCGKNDYGSKQNYNIWLNSE